MAFFCHFNSSGQNVAIAPLLSRPEHEFNAVPGCPTNWPVIVDRLGTNAVSPFPGRTVITEQQLAQLYRSIGGAFTNWHQSVWATYVRTNAAAVEARRDLLLIQYDAAVARLQSQTNAVDFSSLNVPLVVSNLARLRQMELRLQNGR